MEGKIRSIGTMQLPHSHRILVGSVLVSRCRIVFEELATPDLDLIKQVEQECRTTASSDFAVVAVDGTAIGVRIVDTAAPRPDPGNGNPQPDAKPRRQRRHQHSGRHPGREYSGGSCASGRRSAAGQSARAGALSGGAVQPEYAGWDRGPQRRGDPAGR